MGYDQGNDIRPREKRTDTFHPDTCPVQIDDTALRCRYDINRISQISQNLARPEIKIVQTPQNNTGQTLKTAIYTH